MCISNFCNAEPGGNLPVYADGELISVSLEHQVEVYAARNEDKIVRTPYPVELMVYSVAIIERGG